MDDNERLARARKKAGKIRAFYTNLFSYVVFMIFLLVLNLLTSPDFLWVIFPAAGWGLGLLFQGWATFYSGGVFGKEWEERKVREILAREEGSKPKNKEDYFEEGS